MPISAPLRALRGSLRHSLASAGTAPPNAAPLRASSGAAARRRAVWKFGGSSVGNAQAFRDCGGVIVGSHEAGTQVGLAGRPTSARARRLSGRQAGGVIYRPAAGRLAVMAPGCVV